tara:strand:+ start:169 stop:393 length:225 start_codon:yes stop_codon:yes gene_type:complete
MALEKMEADQLDEFVTRRAIIEQLESPFGVHFRAILIDGEGSTSTEPDQSEKKALDAAALHLGVSAWIKDRVKK